MKKSLLLLFLLTGICTAYAQKHLSIDQVKAKWQTVSIKVPGEGKAGIMQLVKAFQQTMPTYSGTELVKFSQSKAKYDKTDKVVDTQNGYVLYSEDDPDSDNNEILEACVWRRSNGHNLFAICFHRFVPELDVLCFYDYNPQTRTLTPEKSLANLFTPSFPGYRYRVFLPQHGKNMKVMEFFGELTIEHEYSWDGMKPVRPQTTIERLYFYQGTFNQDYVPSEQAPFSQYALIDVDKDGKPELWLQSADGSYQAVFTVALTINLVGGQDDRRFLSFYKGAVCNAGHCGALCSSSNYIILKDSYPKTWFNDIQEWDNQLETYGESTYTIDGKEVSKAEGEKLLRSLGTEIEYKPKWKKLKMD